MASLFMLMGVPGSGKSMLAKRLESERPALLLSSDDWMSKIVGDGCDAERRQAVHAMQLDLAESVLRLGSDVILESGFFHRAERDHVRERALAAGAEAHLIFLDPPAEDRADGLEVRHGELPPGAPQSLRGNRELCASQLERPAPDEPLWTWG
jgi:predicted kinase